MDRVWSCCSEQQKETYRNLSDYSRGFDKKSIGDGKQGLLGGSQNARGDGSFSH